MAWTTPTTVSTGDILEAATWNASVVANSLMGQPVFANEAARDAAIGSPVEGMTCYLTSPTVPAATGGTTYLPTGVRTIYNGSAWVCVTQVGAYTQNAGTVTSTSYTPTLSGSPGTNPSVTLVTGTTALVNIRSLLVNNGTNLSAMSVAVSGAGTVSASDDNCMYLNFHTANGEHTFGTTFIIGGLTAGTNTFTLNYRVSAGTGTYYARGIIVQGIA